jgi:integrase/recombinase XerD
MNSEQQKQLTAFKTYLHQIGYTAGTTDTLYRCMKELYNYHNIVIPGDITQQHIQQFYEWLHIRPNKNKPGGLSEKYIHDHMYAVKVFLNWQEQTGNIAHNPSSTMKFKHPVSNSREPLTQENIITLFESCTTAKETAILHLFYSCGLRRSEAQQLNTNDIHFKQQVLYVREGKGAKRRTVPLTLKVTAELERYYFTERIEAKYCHDPDAFILNQKGRRMRGCTYNKVVKNIILRTKVNPEASLHHLRHSIATHLLESDLNVEYIKEFLGHSYLESTQIYTKVRKQQLKKLY